MRPRLGVWCGQLRIERYEHAEDSGGLGRYRGGIGIQAADYRNLSGAPMPVQTEIELSNPAFPSVEVNGGQPGTICSAHLLVGDEVTPLPSKGFYWLRQSNGKSSARGASRLPSSDI